MHALICVHSVFIPANHVGRLLLLTQTYQDLPGASEHTLPQKILLFINVCSHHTSQQLQVNATCLDLNSHHTASCIYINQL